MKKPAALTSLSLGSGVSLGACEHHPALGGDGFCEVKKMRAREILFWKISAFQRTSLDWQMAHSCHVWYFPKEWGHSTPATEQKCSAWPFLFPGWRFQPIDGLELASSHLL